MISFYFVNQGQNDSEDSDNYEMEEDTG